MIKKIKNGDVSQVAGGKKPGIYQVAILAGGKKGFEFKPRKRRANAEFLVLDSNGFSFTSGQLLTQKEAREVARLQFGKDKADGYYATTGKWTSFED